MNEYRTHNCNEIRLSDVGKEVRIAGFVETIRDLGGVVFLDIRDMYGVTQVVTQGLESSLVDFASHIPIESTVTVLGKVRKRDEETYNPKIATGEVEIVIEEIKVLGKRTKNLPFEVNTDQEVREDLRLQYRFLDLRGNKLKNNLLLRAKVLQFLRNQMIEQGFLEVQTPILTSSSPEGARDYLVPSRLHAGKFYALPQAPQQFKQLLMVSGIDKYFQIAPCFRDEDSRADRTPGEFYQLDMEMSYSTQEDVMNVMEPVIKNTFKTFSDKKVSDEAFPKIPYREAMVKYGTDKPDLRNPLFIVDVTDFFQKCTFKPFHGITVRAIKVEGHMSKGFHEKMLEYAKSIGAKFLQISAKTSDPKAFINFITDMLKDYLVSDIKKDYGNGRITIDYSHTIKKIDNSKSI